MAELQRRPAFYAAAPGRAWRDWWTVLHPPYTAWHLSFVVIGAMLVVRPNVTTLCGTLLAFFLAVGIAAHTFDELNGRPLRTAIPASVLVACGGIALSGAAALGVAGSVRIGAVLVPFVVVGTFTVVAYNFELFGGVFHNDFVFAAAWGAFPVLTGYVAQARSVSLAAVAAACFAFALSYAQRALSTPARTIRRSTRRVDGSVELADGRRIPVDEAYILAPLEQALWAMSWGCVALAVALSIERLA